MQEFFSMGGYAVYVWPAFAITAAVLVLNLVLASRQDKRVRARTRDRLRRNNSK